MKQFNLFRCGRYQTALIQHLRNYSKSVSSDWESIIGLEVHAQINARSKLFSGGSTRFAAPVNRNVALFDSAIPGTLPVLNKHCVEAGVMTALALNCRINPISRFDRKHYFYADMPAGFQITQQEIPLAYDGFLEFKVFTPGVHDKSYTTKVKIKQLQLEQDSGKSLHAGDHSLIDLNRAGTALMEIVFEPDLKDNEEAVALVKELMLIFERLQTCTCKMEEGALRIDVNVSVRKKGQPLGVRTEIKNIGSVRGVGAAIKYETNRQIEVIESGGTVVNETRAWDVDSKKTVAMRDKEDNMDYRFMPEPNLPLLVIALGPVTHGCVNADDILKKIPELPHRTRISLEYDYFLSPEQAVILVNENKLLTMFKEATDGEAIDTKLLANLLIVDFLTEINNKKLELDKVQLPGKKIAEITSILQSGMINRATAKLLISEILGGNDASVIQIVKERNWMQINDEQELKRLCREVLDENAKIVQQYRSGKTKVFKALLGLVSAKTKQRADMAKCTAIMKQLLDEK